jgi:hypothetical protein
MATVSRQKNSRIQEVIQVLNEDPSRTLPERATEDDVLQV